jgi:hypothetical protein
MHLASSIFNVLEDERQQGGADVNAAHAAMGLPGCDYGINHQCDDYAAISTKIGNVAVKLG